MYSSSLFQPQQISIEPPYPNTQLNNTNHANSYQNNEIMAFQSQKNFQNASNYHLPPNYQQYQNIVSENSNELPNTVMQLA